MKLIPLNNGMEAMVDDDVYDWLMQWHWRAFKSSRDTTWYAARRPRLKGKRYTLGMHQLLMHSAKGQMVDHVNHNGLDNQMANLRFCTNTQNQQNRIGQSNNTSGYRGVNFHKCSGLWYARIKVNGKRISLAYRHTAEEAFASRREAELKYYGEFAPKD